jgi:anaerobic magnesium-protoporphyrin IX monomethyl ester cyclase
MGFKVRRSEEIRDELVRIKQWGYREVFFRDFTFLPRKNIEVLQFMIDQRLNLSFGCTTRVDTVDEPSLRLMKKAGCYLVFYGAETGVEETLLRMNKGLPLQLLQEITRTTKRIGLETLMSFIIGFPHETGEHIRQTRDMIFKLNPDYLSLNVYVPKYGSEMGETLRQPGTDLDNSQSQGLIKIGGESILQIRKRIERQFFFRPSQMLRYLRLALKSPFRCYNLLRQFRPMLTRVSKDG